MTDINPLEETQSPTLPTEPTPEVQEEVKKRSFVPTLITIFSILILCVVAGVVYLKFFTEKEDVTGDTTENNTTEITEVEEEESLTEYSTFTGNISLLQKFLKVGILLNISTEKILKILLTMVNMKV